ncbi:cyclin-dependent kinase inhibitor 7-like [Neltuma alba]|uniref:cyclin-dependent kinase inhibitor 7-like n=1 Tax=Neltuma alba TaxID=207710 RepID=UPI0010A54C1A|nr:cyclin-dependent kinase inhibitor 7-like [Prosopis alba]XP_028781107.1 cyclin-dependent kinase inhibitor 7-like [Prosopis alba]
MVSKCRRIAEVVAVMEMAQVGVTTRARAALAMGGAAAAASAERKPKRRRINNEELKFSASSSLVQIKGIRRPDVIRPEAQERCSSPPSDELPSSCCSSNGSIGLDEERIEFVDLEVDSAQVETSTCNCGDEREMRPNSEEARPTEANSRCISTVQKMPTEQELEEFFAAAESDIQKRFAEKYSYDIVKDVPLEGRYEWVQIKP